MLKSPNLAKIFVSAIFLCLLTLGGTAFAQDVKAGKKVFKKCKACHVVGEGAKNKVGPHLNDIFGRKAGAMDGFKYSKAMKKAGAAGLVWDDETFDQFIKKPKKLIKKTKMAFSGLKKEKDRVNLIAYLKTFNTNGGDGTPKKSETSPAPKAEAAKPEVKTAAATPKAMANDVALPKHGVFHLGRKALKAEVGAWDIDIRPDGKGLPVGRGTVAMGEPIYSDNCAVCHGDFGEGTDRWPVLAGGQDTLEDDRPEKTIGSYWPYLSTVFDYVKRAMPFGNARSLSDDEIYALTAYMLFLNDIVTDEDFELSNENFTDIRLPNEANFISDSRAKEAHYSKPNSEPCMSNCKPGVAKVVMRARVLDVTPDGDGGEGAGSLE